MAQDLFGIVGTTQAGSFRVERVVAEGGFAVVYRAHHEGFRAPVALKCLKVPDAMTPEQRAAFLEKFREEGELLFRLSAMVPTVVRPLHVDVLSLDGRMVPFLALEWLEGEGLDRIVKQRNRQGKPPIDIRKLVPFLQPAAHALAQAHRLPGPDGPVAVIHRDLKPENIFVARAKGGKGDVVRILDFGIARTKSAAQLDAGAMTSGSALDAFTPGYAAPEQWLPKRYGQVGPWTDVFGLAITMVEVLTGYPPMGGDFGQIAEKTTNVTRRPTPRNQGANVSDEVEQAFTRALAVDPRERTRGVQDFWTELETALGMPPSIHISDKDGPSVSLTGSDPPPPMPGAGNSSQRELAATQAAPVAPTPAAPLYTPPQLSPFTPQEAPQAGSPFTPPQAPRTPQQVSFTPPQSSFTPPRSHPAPSVQRPLADPPSFERAPEASGMPFELAETPDSAAGERSRGRRMDLAEPRPRQHGTMATAGPKLDTARLREHLRGPIQLVALAVLLTVGNWAYTHQTGETLAFGGLRPVWLAGPIALWGVGLACWRILGSL